MKGNALAVRPWRPDMKLNGYARAERPFSLREKAFMGQQWSDPLSFLLPIVRHQEG